MEKESSRVIKCYMRRENETNEYCVLIYYEILRHIYYKQKQNGDFSYLSNLQINFYLKLHFQNVD